MPRLAALLLLLTVASGTLACNSVVGVEDVQLKQAAAIRNDKDKNGSTKGGGDDDNRVPILGQDDTGTKNDGDEGDNQGKTPPNGTTKAACNGATNCERIAFVTRQTFTGKLGGVGGADQKCVEAAKSIPGFAGRPFRAWLSASLTSARARLPKGTSAYRRTDKGIVANSFTDLSDGTVALPIALDEKGVSLGTDSLERSVWTGTDMDGDAEEFTCADWTSDDIMQTGAYGDSQTTDTQWTQSATSSCNAPRHLYCIEY